MLQNISRPSRMRLRRGACPLSDEPQRPLGIPVPPAEPSGTLRVPCFTFSRAPESGPRCLVPHRGLRLATIREPVAGHGGHLRGRLGALPKEHTGRIYTNDLA